MLTEEKLLNPAVPGDQLLIDSLLMAQRLSSTQRQNDPCRLHEERESLIWAYADGFLGEEGEKTAWEEISECRYCLNRLATVQRALYDAEIWIESKRTSAPEKQKTLKPMRVFNFEWVGEAIQKIGEALTVGQLQLVPLMGDVKLTPWKGDLSLEWNELQVTIRTEMGLGSENQVHDIAVSVEIRHQAKPQVEQVLVDFCDVDGKVMETKHTDDKGQTDFSSKEGERFKTSKNEIGFSLELVRGAKTVSWQIVVEPDMQDMTTT